MLPEIACAVTIPEDVSEREGDEIVAVLLAPDVDIARDVVAATVKLSVLTAVVVSPTDVEIWKVCAPEPRLIVNCCNEQNEHKEH